MPRINISFSEEVYKALRAYIRARYGAKRVTSAIVEEAVKEFLKAKWVIQ